MQASSRPAEVSGHCPCTAAGLLVAAGALACAAPPGQGGPGLQDPQAPGPWQALRAGEVWASGRYRFENVDDDAFSREAHASTLRTVLGARTGSLSGFSGLLEFEAVTAVGEERYDSTTNGVSGRPVVPDPEATEVNQAYLAYERPGGRGSLRVRAGRQVIRLDNRRFIGDVGWRQNQQSYDALTLLSEGIAGIPGLEVFLAYLANVNRVLGEDSPAGDVRMESFLANASYTIEGVGKASAYLYRIESDEIETFSTSTYGLRLAGERDAGPLALPYALEGARQSDVAGNPNEVDQGYLLGELGLRRRSCKLLAGYEVQGGSAQPGDVLATPLATLHGFNGFADRFGQTPDGGLVDLYVSASASLLGNDVLVAWHEFDAESGGADYGTEIDAQVTRELSEHVTVGWKLAAYDAEDFSTDVLKIWGWVSLTL